jgi:membrane-bound lytic murein transglycosylase D
VIAVLWLAALASPALEALAASASALPRPPELEPDIRFWKRVFTEVDTSGGFIHDNRRLDVVYEAIRFEPGASAAAEREAAGAAVERYRQALLGLAEGKREGLGQEEARALRAWGPGVGTQTLREAAERVRFQRGQADKFQEGLARSQRWRNHIVRTLESHGVPVEVAALPHVESSYNPNARSHAGAAGLWQFTVPTGKRYLRIDRRVDERLDPYKSTTAAAKLLRYNYEVTGSWPLALTAYNHGAGGVQRAVQAMGTDDITTIVRRYDGPAFGFASRNFYVSFLAAIEVEREGKPPTGPTLRIASADTTAAASGEPRPQARKSTTVKAKPRARHHRVRRGETVWEIAARYGVDRRDLMSLNGLSKARELQAGQVLRLPAGAS